MLVQRNTQALRQGLVDEAKAFAALATKPIGDTFLLYKDSGRLRISQQIDRFIELDPNITNVTVVDNKGQVAYTQKEPAPRVTASEAGSFEPRYHFNKAGELDYIVYPFQEDFGLRRYSLVYEISHASVAASVRGTVLSLVYLSSLALVLSALLTFLFVNRLFLDPIHNVSLQAERISQGELDHEITLQREDEIGRLAKSVNAMADKLKDDIQKLKQLDDLKSEFMMIASHNLRTPLTVISGYIESMREMKLPAAVNKMLDVITASSQRLNVFTEDMLVIAQMEAGDNPFRRTPTDLAALLKQLSEQAAVLAEQKGVRWHAEVEGEAPKANISAPHLRSALWNLLDNALKFTDKGGDISLLAQLTPHQAVISVADTGIGIAKEEIPRLFTKFHRGTSVRTYNYEGTGIGLYVSHLIIKEHGGDIQVVSTHGKGSTFTVTLQLS